MSNIGMVLDGGQPAPSVGDTPCRKLDEIMTNGQLSGGRWPVRERASTRASIFDRRWVWSVPTCADDDGDRRAAVGGERALPEERRLRPAMADRQRDGAASVVAAGVAVAGTRPATGRAGAGPGLRHRAHLDLPGQG